MKLPDALSNSLGTNGGIIDLIAAIVIIITALLLSRGASETARVQNILVVLKVLAILLFLIVGLSVVDIGHYVPFIPEYKMTADGAFGGWQGIYAGSSVIFICISVLIRLLRTQVKPLIHIRQCHVVFLGHWSLR